MAKDMIKTVIQKVMIINDILDSYASDETIAQLAKDVRFSLYQGETRTHHLEDEAAFGIAVLLQHTKGQLRR